MSFSQRTLNFLQPGVFGFGFPGSHLLAMRYLPAGCENQLKDEIHFYFTTKALVVEGQNLEKLYVSLLLGNPTQTGQVQSQTEHYRITAIYPREYVTEPAQASGDDKEQQPSEQTHKAKGRSAGQ